MIISYSFKSDCKSYIFLSTLAEQGRSQRWGRGGNRPPPRAPHEGLLPPPPRTFTGLITEGQLEHYGINTEEKINGKYKRKVQETSKFSDKFINIYAKNVKIFPSFLFLII